MVVERAIEVKNRLGLHARPAALFVQTANKFRCEIEVRRGRQKVNGKSIMGIMMLAAGKGTRINVRCEGQDADRAIRALQKLLSTEIDKE
ncbi:MAG: HPr family phosphocarrier protein [Candidatus Omnitrophica bacterium]|nr:HPr family phosphocarrier protein [Candidatus Omnitrophota bacterium]